MKRRTRQGLLSLHIIVSVGLLGSDAALLALSVAGARGAPGVAVYPAALLVGQWLLLPLAALSLLTGVAQGLLTPWGVVRYHWTLLKLVLNTAGLTLAWLVLLPSLHAAANQAQGALHAVSGRDRLGLVRNSSAAITVLVVTVLLSVFKPFGRIAARRPPRTAGAGRAVGPLTPAGRPGRLGNVGP